MIKKALSLIMFSLLLLCNLINFTPVSYAEDKLTPEASYAYFNVLYKIIYGDPNKDTYGIHTFSPIYDHNLFIEYSQASFNIDNNQTGVLFADLIDFDNNGSSELFFVYLTSEGNYVFEVYGFDNKLVKIYSKTNSLDGDFSLSLLNKDNKTYIIHNDSKKKYLDGGGFDHYSYTECISFNNNKYNIESLYSVMYAFEPNDINKYKSSENSPEKDISESQVENILSSWHDGSTNIISQHFPISMTGNYTTDLHLRDNDLIIHNFLYELLTLSSPNYTFKEVSSNFTKSEYDNLTEFMSIFLHDYIMLHNHDNSNIDKTKLLEFIFNLSEYTMTDTLKPDAIDSTDGIFSIKLSLDKINNQINKLFGISLDLKEGDKFLLNNYDEGINDTVIIKNGFAERTKIDASRGDLLYLPIIKQIYYLSNDYYLLDINEDCQEQDGSITHELNKFYAIVKKLDNGSYNLIKIQDKPFENQDSIEKYMKNLDNISINSNKNNKYSLPHGFIILISLLISISLICLSFVFIKFSNNVIPIYVSITLFTVSIIIGVVVYIVLDNNYVTNSTNPKVGQVNSIDNSNSSNDLSNNIDNFENNISTPEIESSNENPENTYQNNNENVEKNKEIIINEEDDVTVDEKEEISILLDGLLNDYVYAVEIGDPSIMHKYVTTNGKAFKDYEKNIPSFYNSGITLESLDYEILNLSRESNGDIRLSYSTSFEITNPNGKRYQEEMADFIVVYDDEADEYLIDRLENWKITHKENI